MAHKKGQGSSRNGRDSKPKFRGVKMSGGSEATAGNIIVRQCGSKIHPGVNVGQGRDFTLWAKIDGLVKFERYGKDRQRVHVFAPGDPRLSAVKPPRGPRAQAQA